MQKERQYESNQLRPNVRIGHVHLRGVDLARAAAFYGDVPGFDGTAHGPAELSAE